MQTGISDLARLAAQGIVDPKRACIVGASYGGYAALAGVTLEQGLYRCAVSYSGVADVTGIFQYDSERGGGDSRRWMRAAIGDNRLMEEISPTTHAAKADAPVLLLHGKDDTVVPLKQSQAMDRELRRAGKSVEFVTLEGEDHWLSTDDTRIAMLKAAVAFVEKHNPAN